jgi:hypothetical protein
MKQISVYIINSFTSNNLGPGEIGNGLTNAKVRAQLLRAVLVPLIKELAQGFGGSSVKNHL